MNRPGSGDRCAAPAAAVPSAARIGAQNSPIGIAALEVVDRKSPADIQRIERAPALRAPGCSSSRQTSIASTCLPGAVRLRSDVERQALDIDAAARAASVQQSGAPLADRSRICATGRRPLRGCGTTRGSAARRGRGSSANLRISSGLSATNMRTPNASAVRMSRVTLDRVRVDAALGRHAESPHELHLAAGRQIEASALARPASAPRQACGSGFSA